MHLFGPLMIMTAVARRTEQILFSTRFTRQDDVETRKCFEELARHAVENSNTSAAENPERLSLNLTELLYQMCYCRGLPAVTEEMESVMQDFRLNQAQDRLYEPGVLGRLWERVASVHSRVVLGGAILRYVSSDMFQCRSFCSFQMSSILTSQR